MDEDERLVAAAVAAMKCALWSLKEAEKSLDKVAPRSSCKVNRMIGELVGEVREVGHITVEKLLR